MTHTEIAVVVGFMVLVPAGLYGLHRLALYLESKDLMYYMKKQPQSGWMSSSLAPLQELMQPEIRHVAKVQDLRQVRDDSGDDDPPPSEKPDSAD